MRQLFALALLAFAVACGVATGSPIISGPAHANCGPAHPCEGDNCSS